jgi:hypothetical protein
MPKKSLVKRLPDGNFFIFLAKQTKVYNEGGYKYNSENEVSDLISCHVEKLVKCKDNHVPGIDYKRISPFRLRISASSPADRSSQIASPATLARQY